MTKPFLFILCLLPHFLLGDYQVIHSFDEALETLAHANTETLVIFDVDDVLIAYEDMLLRPCGSHYRSPSWQNIEPEEFQYLLSIMLRDGSSTLVDPKTPNIIQSLQNKKVKVIALTAARTGQFGVIKNAEDWRIAQLKKMNIDFTSSFPNLLVHFSSFESAQPLFKSGVLFLGNESLTKGELLVTFLKHINWKPDNVIFFDDKTDHLINVELALQDMAIPFNGYHFRGVDNLSGRWNEEIAELQLTKLRIEQKWYSDHEAEELLCGSNP